jgi:hypothetical protein
MNVELTEIEILMLRGLDAKPALDIPGGIVDDNMDELIDIGYISVRIVDNLFSYEITDDGRAALKRSEGGKNPPA